MDIFHRHRRFVHENTHGQRKAAQSHEMDRLPREPKRHQCGEEREGNVNHHDKRAAPVTEEEQHHQSGKDRTQPTLLQDIPDGAVDHRRLVKDVADLDVVRQDFLKLRDILFYQLNDL